MPETAVRRPLSGYLSSANPNLRAQGQYLQSGQVPDGYSMLPNGGGVTRNPHGYGGFINDHGWEVMAGLVGGGTLAGMALGPGVAGSAGSIATPNIGVSSGLPSGLIPGAGTSATGASAAAKAGAAGMNWGKIFKGGFDPTALALGGLSALFGGGNDGQQVNSYHKGVSPAAAQLVDPIQSLYNALAASDRMGVNLSHRLSNGHYLPSSFVQQGPAPVTIPGLSFQIGGGLATDPALRDPSLLRSQPIDGDMYSSVIPGGPNTPGGSKGVQRRTR